MKLALCIVGCGQFARTFVQGLQPVRVDLDLFFASRDEARARAYAALFQGCGAFGSYEAAAADPRMEAMYLCTPHHLHQAHVALAAQAGKHILVEKPIARTLAEGRAMLAQVLQVIQYVELTGMVKWVMVGHDALTAAEAQVPDAQRLTLARDAWTGQEQRLQDMQQYLRRDGYGEISPPWQKLAEVAPAILDGYIRMRENFVTPDPLGAVPKKLMELAIIAADVVQAHPWGARTAYAAVCAGWGDRAGAD
jgi:hypothetical protein